MGIDAAAILALISSLTSQIAELQAEVSRLRAAPELDIQDPPGDVPAATF